MLVTVDINWHDLSYLPIIIDDIGVEGPFPTGIHGSAKVGEAFSVSDHS